MTIAGSPNVQCAVAVVTCQLQQRRVRLFGRGDALCGLGCIPCCIMNVSVWSKCFSVLPSVVSGHGRALQLVCFHSFPVVHCNTLEACRNEKR